MSIAVPESLALHGGPPVRTEPWPKRRLFGEAEKQAALKLLDRCVETGDAYSYSGEEEEAYCREFVAYLTGSADGGFADMVNSGSAALFVAVRSLDLPAFSEVIVSPITDPGGMMPVPMLNLVPVVADAATGSFNVGVQQIAERLTERTSAIVVTHIAGKPVDMDPILALAKQHDLRVVEDVAQAHGAEYKGRKLGTLGDVAAFSTMSGKHHATGGQGGVVFTVDPSLHMATRRASDRGKPFGIDNPNQGNTTAGLNNVSAALNLNQDEMSAAIGRVQLAKLDGIVARRRAFGLALASACEGLQTLRVESDPPGCKHAFWFTFVDLDLSKLSCTKAQWCEALQNEGFPAFLSYFHAPSEMAWFRNRSVFTQPGYPWASPDYHGDKNPTWPLPNARATDAHRVQILTHENCGEQEIADLIEAFHKLEAAFL